MATAKNEEGLRVVLLQAIIRGYEDVALEAGKSLKKHFVRQASGGGGEEKGTGPQVLDFHVVNDFTMVSEVGG
jgi:hypothetical protein